MFRFRLCLVFLIFLIPGCVPQQDPTPLQKENVIDSATLYDEVVLEIVSPAEKGPSAEALAFFINRLKLYNICNKVTVSYSTDIVGSLPVWNTGLIHQFEARNRKLKDTDPEDKKLVLFVCYLEGIYIQGDVASIAGLQYGPTSFAIFRDITKASYEGVVLLHEFGHIIQIARSSNRKESPVNPDRPNHCNDKSCVMYWRSSKDRINLDSKCLKDLERLINDTSQIVAVP